MRTETGRAFLFLTGSPQCYAVGPWGEFLGTSISGKLSDGIECLTFEYSLSPYTGGPQIVFDNLPGYQ